MLAWHLTALSLVFRQGNQAIQQSSYQIRAGDSFRLTCNYKSNKEGQVFGLASSDEMCIGYITYYPRKALMDGRAPWICPFGLDLPDWVDVGGCADSTYESQVLASDEDLVRIFGKSMKNASCLASPEIVDKESSGGLSSFPRIFILPLTAVFASIDLLF